MAPLQLRSQFPILQSRLDIRALLAKTTPQNLKLTAMEELMLHQDSSGYPCAILVRLFFRGKLSRKQFECAAAAALARHPLLSARVDRSRRVPTWELSDEPAAWISWHEKAVDELLSSVGFLDIETMGMQLIVHCDEQTTGLLLHVHHACCDGLGVYQFIQDLLTLYAREAEDTADSELLRELRPSDLPSRAWLGLSPGKLLRMLPRQAVGLVGVREFLTRSPVPIIPHDRDPHDAPTPAAYPAICSSHFDRNVSQAIGLTARERGVTTNELLCACLFEALHAFRAARGVAGDDEWLRLMIPMNMRWPAAARLPAANIVSAIFLDRQATSIADHAGLLKGIHDQMQIIKQNQLGYTFVFSLQARRWLPGGIRRGARGLKCNASAVFTNVGRVLANVPLPWEDGSLRCGDVLLDRAEIAAPLTPFTCAAFGATWFADRMAISLHYDPRPLTRQDADELLHRFVNRIFDATGSSASQLIQR